MPAAFLRMWQPMDLSRHLVLFSPMSETIFGAAAVFISGINLRCRARAAERQRDIKNITLNTLS